MHDEKMSDQDWEHRPSPMETLGTFRIPSAPVPPPGGYQQPRPPWVKPAPKKRNPVGWLLVAALVLLILMCVGALAIGEPQPARESPGTRITQGPDSPLGYRVGQQFTAGDFRYQVHEVKTGIAEVGNKLYGEKAQGSFTRLDITVSNVGAEAKFFDADWYLKLADTDGRQFSADTAANIAGNDGEDGWLTEINPGNSMRAFIYFDLPKGVTAQTAQVSAGMLSFRPDVIVSLS